MMLIALSFLDHENDFTPFGGDLMREFKNALLKQRTNRASGSRLAKLQDNQNKSLIQRRLSELEVKQGGGG
ncbi:hypothetical protein Bca52824_086947 [Brassica carinata]|uniref:Uncharacterized protein n=1 Tax=Brassica carinata TaxID=52824 RepID=A0A8X7TMQ6_BRACI|nr:hypothetical protein Bca52824_086947 [Brassica carinata]